MGTEPNRKSGRYSNLPLLLYNAVQDRPGIDLPYFITVPILCAWDLCIKGRIVHTNVDPFHFSYLLIYGILTAALGIVKYIEVNTVSLALRLCHNAVLQFTLLFYTHEMLCDPPQHIVALADVNDLPIDFDTVNTWVFIFFRKSVALHPPVHIFRITFFSHYEISLICYIHIIPKFFIKNKVRGGGGLPYDPAPAQPLT